LRSSICRRGETSPVILQLLIENKLPLTAERREIFAQHKEQRSLVILERALREADDGFLRSLLQEAIMVIKSSSPDREAK